MTDAGFKGLTKHQRSYDNAIPVDEFRCENCLDVSEDEPIKDIKGNKFCSKKCLKEYHENEN